MTRLYASHVSFRFCSGKSCNTDCHSLLQAMNMVGAMSHIAVVERVALNRRSMSLKVSFTRDISLTVPFDTKSIPDRFDLTMRCWNPEISSHCSIMKCCPEIESINVDGSKGTLSINTFNGGPLVNIEIQYSSIAISANIPESVISADKETE